MRASITLLITGLILLSAQVHGQDGFFTPTDIPYATYAYDVDIDLNQQVIAGEGTISLVNTGKLPISVIALDWIINDFRLLQLRQHDQVVEWYNPSQQTNLNPPVYAILPEPVAPGEELMLEVAFKLGLILPEEVESYDTQHFLPKLWWDDIPVSDRYQVKINDIPGYELAVGGRLNAATGYYENDHAQQFGLFISREVDVLEEEVEGVLVRVLYPDQGRKVADLAMQTAKQVIPYYQELLGFYPYDFLTILPGGNGVYGGYPYASGMVVIHGMHLFDQGSVRHWRWITAHEIGHQYWGEYVLDGDDPPWLWIALGIYADREFTQYAGISDLKHRGWANYYLDGVRKGLNTIFDIRPDEEAEIDFDRNNYVIHAKGFSFISALEFVLGKETFRQAYRTTLNRYGGERLTYRNFQRVCEEVSGQSLQWFFDDWVRSNRYLSAVVGGTSSVREGDQYLSTVRVIYDGDIIMPVPVTAVFEDGTVQTQMTHRMGTDQNVTFSSTSRLTGATIDPSGYLANLPEYLPPTAEEIRKEISQLSYSGSGKQAMRIYGKIYTAIREEIGDAWYKLGMVLFDGGYYPQSRSAFLNSVRYGPESDKFISTAWVGHLYDILQDRSAAIQYYQEALELDQGDTYQHSQYNMTVDRKWLEDRLETPFELRKKLNW